MNKPTRYALCFAAPLALAFSLSACDPANAPSEEVARAAEDAVAAVEGEPVPETAQGPLAPRNDCRDHEGAQAFIDLLETAVQTRDTDTIIALSAPDVKLGFGGEDGEVNFRKALDAPDGEIWNELARMFALGCAVDPQGGIAMPWYSQQPIKGDSFDLMIVTGEKVPLHAAPLTSSNVVSTLSWDAVALVPDPVEQGETALAGLQPEGWRHVQTLAAEGETGIEGYIRQSSLRSVLDYRLMAAKHRGKWQIVAFLAGD